MVVDINIRDEEHCAHKQLLRCFVYPLDLLFCLFSSSSFFPPFSDFAPIIVVSISKDKRSCFVVHCLEINASWIMKEAASAPATEAAREKRGRKEGFWLNSFDLHSHCFLAISFSPLLIRKPFKPKPKCLRSHIFCLSLPSSSQQPTKSQTSVSYWTKIDFDLGQWLVLVAAAGAALSLTTGARRRTWFPNQCAPGLTFSPKKFKSLSRQLSVVYFYEPHHHISLLPQSFDYIHFASRKSANWGRG